MMRRTFQSALLPRQRPLDKGFAMRTMVVCDGSMF
jgi:hypothetical protein